MEQYTTDTNLIVIKGRFKASATSSFGMFIVFMDNVTKSIEKFDILASHFSTVYENNPNIPWAELEEMITHMKFKGEYATNLTHDIQASMEDLFEPGTGRGIDIWGYLKKNHIGKAVAVFDEILTRPTGDKNIKTEIVIEMINKSDIDKIKQERIQKENQEMIKNEIANIESQSAGIGVDDTSVVLEVDLVLSPISGVPIADIKQGQKIMVKISESSSRGQYFIDLLGASVDNEIVPVPAAIDKVEYSGKMYTVTVNIGPGIFGTAITEDNVKTKLYNPAFDKRNKTAIANANSGIQQGVTTGVADNSDLTNGFKEDKGPNYLVFIIIGGLALIALLIVVFLFL